MSGHAVLSPSSADRWLTCPGSVLATRGLESSSEWAAEGTLAHSVAEHIARHKTRHGLEPLRSEAEARGWDFDAMVEAGTTWATIIGEVRETRHTKPSVTLLEHRLSTGIEECWGTADAVIISENRVDVLDFKYGAGVAVDVEDNTQLRLYGLAALNNFDGLLGDITVVGTHIFQPRVSGWASTVTPAAELLSWREELRPKAALALTEGAPFQPTDAGCRWCPLSGRCRAQADQAMAHAQEVFTALDAPGLTPSEVAEHLSNVKDIRAWCTKLEEVAWRMVWDERTPLPGWKVVRSKGKRTFADVDTAVARLVEAGFDEAAVSRRGMATLTALDKLVGGADVLGEIVGDALVRSEGRPTLAPEADPRPEMDDPASVFAPVEDKEENGCG